MQMKSLVNRDDNFILRFGWRLSILGVIGVIHHVLWRGDILTIYVPLGFLLIVARNLSNRAILGIGFLLILNIPTKIYEIVYLLVNNKMPFFNPNFEQEGQHYLNIIKSAPYQEVIRDNINAVSEKLNYQISSGRLIITFGFFLLGMFVGRMQWFEKLDEAKPYLRSIWKKSGIALLCLIGVGALIAAIIFALGMQNGKNPWHMWAGGFFADLFNATLTIFYITGFTLLMFREKWNRVLSPLASVGKMALTSYLMQTLFGLALFYSFGFGLFAKTTPAINALIALGIFGVQIVFSRWWLSRFYYGPVEWLWRSATFFKLQKMLKMNT
jgi:uncharacterized protein